MCKKTDKSLANGHITHGRCYAAQGQFCFMTGAVNVCRQDNVPPRCAVLGCAVLLQVLSWPNWVLK
jgi:hypothetical protein